MSESSATFRPEPEEASELTASPFAGVVSHFEGRRVLVTGGLGFIGSNITQALSAAGACVVVLDDGFTGRPESIEGCPNTTLIEGSVTDPGLVRRAAEGSDTIFHLACRNIIVSTSDPAMDCMVNTVGTVNVLLAARETGARRVVYASSASLYGNPRHIPAREDDPPVLMSPYAASKYAGECFCMGYYESFQVPVAALRYSNVYGPMQSPENPYCGVVSRFMDAALRGETLRIYGDGEQTRDFTYIDDVVNATLGAALSARAEGQIYNVATGIELSINRLASLVVDLCDLPCAIEYAPRRDIDTIRRRVLSAERIRHDLRWSATVTIEEGLRRTFAWLRKQTEARS